MTRFLLHWRTAVCGVGTFLAAACVSTSLVEVAPTNGVADPASVTTPTGAMQLYSLAIAQWAASIAGGGGGGGGSQPLGVNYVLVTGRWTDELMRVQDAYTTNPFSQGDDERNDGSITQVNVGSSFEKTIYGPLQTNRLAGRQARQALEAYAPNSPPAWRGRMLAMEGYGIVYLAEFFCSGIPLTTASLNGSVALTPGFSTEDMLAQAIPFFDSAGTLAGDSTRFRYLAAVGKGRALLQAGKFADAAIAVASVPTDYVFLLETNSATTITPGANQPGLKPQNVQVRDNEGGNGLVWSTDPRAAVVTTPALSGAMLVPGKYSVTAGGTINAAVSNPNAPMRAADGLEARLIEAEAALAAGDASWLTKLNALRSTCIATTPCAPVPGLTAAALPPLTDPGTANTRLDLLMKERAMWLYLTGHRQGDLRRLARIYHRDPMTLWPVGLYVNPGFLPQIPPAVDNGIVNYINQFVVSPSVSQEAQVNPLYAGCNDTNP